LPIKRRRLPGYYELVVGTVSRIYDHGAFIKLDEYNGIEAYCPLNEVARSWFRNVRDVLKEGQKAVFKVIRVDRRRGHVDVSLRRVADDERREKMREWKRALHAEKLLELAAAKLNKTLYDAYREAGWKLEDHYKEIYAAFEEAVRRGINVFLDAGVPEEWAKVLYKLAKEHIELPEIKLSGVFTLQSYDKKGVLTIKEVLTKAFEMARNYPIKNIKIYTVGAPRYRIDLVANDPKIALHALQTIVNKVTEEATKKGCKVSFEKLRSKS